MHTRTHDVRYRGNSNKHFKWAPINQHQSLRTKINSSMMRSHLFSQFKWPKHYAHYAHKAHAPSPSPSNRHTKFSLSLSVSRVCVCVYTDYRAEILKPNTTSKLYGWHDYSWWFCCCFFSLFFREENVSISISFYLPAIRVFAIKLDFHV